MREEASAFASLKVNRLQLHEQIAESIQQIIAGSQLQPGTPLPSERELAATLGVNRATVREALRLLQQRGLVQVRVGSGTFVRGMPQSIVTECIERFLVFGSCSDQALIQLREILEPESAALAAEHASPEDLARLEARVSEIEAAVRSVDRESYAAADLGFHEALARASGNELISAILDGLAKVLHAWLRGTSGRFAVEQGALSHRPVYAAVAAHDADLARRAMREHMQLSRATLLQMSGTTDSEQGGTA